MKALWIYLCKTKKQIMKTHNDANDMSRNISQLVFNCNIFFVVVEIVFVQQIAQNKEDYQ